MEFSTDEENETAVPASEASNSLKGNALRILRKHIDYSLTFSQSTLSETRNQPVEPEILPSAPRRLLTLPEGFVAAHRLLNKIGYMMS